MLYALVLHGDAMLYQRSIEMGTFLKGFYMMFYKPTMHQILFLTNLFHQNFKSSLKSSLLLYCNSLLAHWIGDDKG